MSLISFPPSSGGGGGAQLPTTHWIAGEKYAHNRPEKTTSNNPAIQGNIYLVPGQIPTSLTNPSVGVVVNNAGTENSAGSGEIHVVCYDKTGSQVFDSPSLDGTTTGGPSVQVSASIDPDIYYAGVYVSGWSTMPQLKAYGQASFISKVSEGQFTNGYAFSFSNSGSPPSSVDLASAGGTNLKNAPVPFWYP